MRRFDLLRRGGRAFRILIDGRPVRTGSLPGGWFHHRRLVKYATDIVVVRLNQAHDGPVSVLDPSHPGGVELDERAGIAGITARRGGHRVRLGLVPALPDLRRLEPWARSDGTWHLDVDELRIGGTWSARRSTDDVDLVMDVTRGWKPSGLPLLMRTVTLVVRVFRSWPTTYRWLATITLGPPPHMSSHWERTGGERGSSYRRFTRSAVSR
jgi:hypothetical protein